LENWLPKMPGRRDYWLLTKCQLLGSQFPNSTWELGVGGQKPKKKKIQWFWASTPKGVVAPKPSLNMEFNLQRTPTGRQSLSQEIDSQAKFEWVNYVCYWLCLEGKLKGIKWGYFETLVALEEVIPSINSDLWNCRRSKVSNLEAYVLGAFAN
jgi:hypothetical protein